MYLHLTNPISKGWSYRDPSTGFLYVLGNRHQPPSGSIIVSGEFMIVTRLGKHPKGFIVEPVEPDHQLVQFDGFMRPMIEGAVVQSYSHTLRKMITPGKLTNLIYVALAEETKIPGVGYVKRGESRLAGVPDVKELHRSFN